MGFNHRIMFAIYPRRSKAGTVYTLLYSRIMLCTNVNGGLRKARDLFLLLCRAFEPSFSLLRLHETTMCGLSF